MFTQGTAIIDRTVEEVYEFLADLKRQLGCWDMLHVPGMEELSSDSVEVEGFYSLGKSTSACVIELHRTRPGSGVVTRVSWASGELAAEWRVMEEGNRTRLELNIEGTGGGLATSVALQQITPRILARLKRHFDMA